MIICIGWSYVGEGYVKADKKWYRYCDLGPVEKYMREKVVAWREMDSPPKVPKYREPLNKGKNSPNDGPH